jgi:hypothetical protein
MDYYGDSPAKDEFAPWIFPALVMLARFGNCCAFFSIYRGTTDLFPVLFNSTAYGICNFVARGSSIFAPLAAEVKSNLPMIIYTVLCLISLAASTCLQKFNEKSDIHKD